METPLSVVVSRLGNRAESDCRLSEMLIALVLKLQIRVQRAFDIDVRVGSIVPFGDQLAQFKLLRPHSIVQEMLDYDDHEKRDDGCLGIDDSLY